MPAIAILHLHKLISNIFFNISFTDNFGCYKGFRDILRGAKPVYTKPYWVPYGLRPKVEQESDRLEKAGVISTSFTSDPQLKIVLQPNIKIYDILADLADGVKFSKLDFANSYNQMEVSN